jgi:subfamily B ATP-binding cassette protein MsbA
VAQSPQSATRIFIRLLAYARPYLAIVALAVAFSWLYGAGLSGRALLLEPLIDDVAIPSVSLGSIGDVLDQAGAQDEKKSEDEREFLAQRVRDNFMQVLFVGAFIIISMPLVRLVRDYASMWIMSRLYADLQAAVGDKLVRLPLAHHVREGRGDFVARLTNDTMVANRAHAVVFGDVVQDTGILLVSLGLAFYVSWQLTLVVVLIGPPVAVVLQVFGRRIRKSSARRQEQISDVTQRLMQMLSGIKVIKAFHAEDRERELFRDSVMRYFRRSMKVVRNRVLSRSLTELVTQGSFVSVFFVGIYMVVEGWGDLTLGKLTTFILISAMFYRPVRGVATVYNTIQDALPAAVRVFEVLDAPEVSPDRPGAIPIERVAEGIRFDGVTFSYEREAVLAGIDLEIPAGQVVALVGRSGAGKTTIADLLLRFHEPDAGSVLIDGHDLRDIQRGSLHDLTAIVTQEAFLFDDSIRGNICYGRPDASDAQIEAASRAANAHEFIAALPEGYDTPVGDLGAKLSGGQRQRLTIARAILRDPQILIFDEATSALDAQAEQQVQGAISNLMRGRTVLLIAHRLSTVRAADMIAVVEDGKISMTGTHDELIARGGLYRDLVEAQLVTESPAA